MHTFQWTAEGIEPSLSGCRPDVFPLDDGPVIFNVARRIRTFILELRRLVLIRLSYRNDVFLDDPGRIRTCTKLVLSQPPLPIGLLDLIKFLICANLRHLRHLRSTLSAAIAPSRTRTRITPVKSRRLCL